MPGAGSLLLANWLYNVALRDGTAFGIIPADRVAALRKAFMDTLQDKEFLAEAEKAKLEINPVAGEAVQSIVQEVYQTPKALASKAADMVNR